MGKVKNILKNIDFWFILLSLIVSIVFIGMLFQTKLLVMKYMMIIISIIVLLLAIIILILFNNSINRLNKILTRIICLILVCFLTFGSVVVNKGLYVLKEVSKEDKVQKNSVSVIVLKDSEYKKINDIKEDEIGILDKLDRFHTERMFQNLEEKKNLAFNKKEYEDYSALVKALYDKKVNSIVMNESYRTMILENFEDFGDKTEILYNFEYEQELENIRKDVLVTKESFNIFVSGIDVYGDISQISRSDVNMIVTVNPKTKEILLTNIPRDYYVGLSCANYKLDKLTHAGNFGVSCSVGTVEKLFDIDLNYYVRLNFSSVMDIVDALGGVTVYVEYPFQRKEFKFSKGYQWMSGTRAMWFARERKAFPGGDNQRIKNHQYLLQGVIDKVTSPEIITRYDKFLEAIAGSFETNFTQDEITSFIAMQLDDMADWTITSQTVSGVSGMDTTYSMGSMLVSVMYPVQSTVDAAKAEIDKIFNNK